MFFTLGIKFKRISGLFLVGIFLLSLIILSAPEAAAASKKGPVKRNGTLYFFNSKGKPAKSGRERKLSYKGKSYYVLRDGRIRKGWNVIGNDLYYFGRKSGVMQKNTVIAGITLLPDGKAQKSCKIHGKKTRSLDVSIRTKCIKVLKSRGVYNKSQAAQLRSAWTYLTNRKTFHYSKKYPNLGDPKWTKKYADFMLSAHRGNCYGFACTFAAFAWTIGYDPYVVAGRCPGGRDGARDGFTRHCVARINGRWYDPEYWAIYRSHYLYGAGGLSYTFKNRRTPVRFKKVKGTITPTVKTIAGRLKKVNGRFYLFNSRGKARKGVFYIKKKLYNFSKKGKYGACMTKKAYKKYQRAARKGKSYTKLRKLIGKASSYNDECDMYSSRTFLYKHIAVNAYRNSKGRWVINKIYDRKSLQI